MTESHDLDSQLMLRFQAGDESSFAQLVDRHQRRVLALVYRFGAASAEAEDLAQEVFLSVYRAKDSYQPVAKFTTWLYVICRNSCYKQLRRPRLATLPLATGEDGEQEWEMPDPDQDSPDEAVERTERAAAVRAAIAALPENQRLAVLLRRYEDLPQKEIAETLGCTPAAVKTLLARARASLKTLLSPYLRRGEPLPEGGSR